MQERKLRFDDLHVEPKEVYEQMGYGDIVPDADVLKEIEDITERIRSILHPRFCFFISKAELIEESDILNAAGTDMNIGRIITRQLRGSQAYIFFVATAGEEFEHFQHQLKEEGDIVKVYIADAMGSVIAEKTADRMEEALQECIDSYGWKHTNRFSPGYCGWHVSEQQKLFRLFPTEHPCGVKLTDSSLMLPIKSVSGVIGIGENVRKQEYTCGLCNYEKCYKRRKKQNI